MTEPAGPTTVAVTGATGLVGGNLAVLLAGLGHDVVCTRRRSSKVDHLGHVKLRWVEADLDDEAALARAFAGAAAVFHCAAQVTVSGRASAAQVSGNVDGTRRILGAVRTARVPRLVHCSSVATCAISPTATPVTEDAAWNFAAYGLDDGYATTKREAELLVLQAAREDVDAVVVNPTYMFGPFDVKPSSGRMILDVVRGKAPGYPDGMSNFVDVRDVCRGMIAAWQQGRRGERYILGHENLSYRDAWRLIADVAGARAPRLRIPRGLAMAVGLLGDLKERVTGKVGLINSTTVRYGYERGYQFSSDKAKRELGYAPGSLRGAIGDALAWFRQAGMLA